MQGSLDGLITKQNELVSNSDVRSLMKAVCQDPQLETIDYKKSVEKVSTIYYHPSMDNRTQARIDIMSFLNHVFFSFHDFHPIRDWNTPQGTWLWENHTRLSKLLVVSMILESKNLISFGATPKWDDIPQALTHLFNIIHEMRTTYFPQLKEQYKAKVKLTAVLCPDYLDLYTQDRPTE